MINDAALALDQRSRLPDALRVLLKAYPRHTWESDPGLDDLARFWLDRHLMFRRLLDQLQTITRARLSKELEPMHFAARLSQLGSTFVGELHVHHNVEDLHYFPRLAEQDPRIEQGFELLHTDHMALETHIAAFVSCAESILQTPQQAEIGPLGEEIDHLARLLDRHLTDEEEIVVPVILKYGASGLT